MHQRRHTILIFRVYVRAGSKQSIDSADVFCGKHQCRHTIFALFVYVRSGLEQHIDELRVRTTLPRILLLHSIHQGRLSIFILLIHVRSEVEQHLGDFGPAAFRSQHQSCPVVLIPGIDIRLRLDQHLDHRGVIRLRICCVHQCCPAVFILRVYVRAGLNQHFHEVGIIHYMHQGRFASTVPRVDIRAGLEGISELLHRSRSANAGIIRVFIKKAVISVKVHLPVQFFQIDLIQRVM